MLTMVSAMDRARRLYGARPAVVDDEGTFTWNEFVDRARRAASVLDGLGIGGGDRYAILSRNTFRNAELMHAGYWSGRVPVPINIRLAGPEIRHILDDAGCKLLVVDEALTELATADELAPWRGRTLLVAAEMRDSPWPQYEALLADAAPAGAHEPAEDDTAILLYTGGTTGRSKGVPLSHRNVFANGQQCAIALGARTDDVFLHAAPMFHSADLLGTAYTLQGAAHMFLPVFSPESVLRAMERHGVTVAFLAPTMIIMILQDPAFENFDLAKLRLVFYGSSPMAVEWIRRAMEALPGAQIQQGYGLTETSPILTTLDPGEHREALESGRYDWLKAAGRPVTGVDMRIVDRNGDEVPLGEAGEVAVRGPNVTSGYLNRPEETASAFRGGWFHTGDIGRMDEEGFMYLLDRKKDMIVTGGENVYSSEVEAALYQHPGVSEAAVVGVPDETYGEALFAVIVPAPGVSLDVEGMIAHCRERIGGYKIPRRMAFVDEMPKSAMGKILKTELRRIYGGDKA